jgi:LmbE family N-acetylglucosaminyl deacetylase
MIQVATTDDIKRLGTILSVWAHPDDESFLAAGVMAAAAQNGQKVVCVTATKGELGVQDETKWPAEKLADIRAEELSQALAIIGCQDHTWLGYKDGECADIDINEPVNKLKKIIENTKPDSILTFGPDGWTGHSDHATVSRWVSRAITDSNVDVYHVIHTPEHYDKYFKVADDALNIFFNIDMPPLLPSQHCDIYFELPEQICQMKCEALEACPSQTEMLFKMFKRDFLNETFGIECFVKAS